MWFLVILSTARLHEHQVQTVQAMVEHGAESTSSAHSLSTQTQVCQTFRGLVGLVQ